jgi:GNAT superfamily N-acetyltransferase
MNILRASIDYLSDAEFLLKEYYEAIGVVKRDAPETIVDYLSDEASGLWIAYVDGEPAGCVVLRPLRSVESAVECKRLYVRPQFRGLGVAQALLDVSEQFALSTSSTWIYLDSMDDLKDALRLYIKRGYQSCERYNDNPQADVFLRKNLRGWS